LILDSHDEKDIKEMQKYGKTKGMILVKKYFPSFNVYERIIILNSKQDLKKLENILPELFFVRVDYIIGKQTKYLPGKNIDKDNLLNYIVEVNKLSVDANVVILLEKQINEYDLIHTNGSFNIHFDCDKFVYFDYVGNGFDASNITKGQATHESWKIPFKEILFLDSKNINKYKIFEVSNIEYANQLIKRKEELKNHLPNYIKEIEKINKEYVKCDSRKIQMVIEKIILPVMCNLDSITKDVGKEFGLQCNFIKDGIEMYEINRPERMVKPEN
jgi:hypothetical protein